MKLNNQSFEYAQGVFLKKSQYKGAQRFFVTKIIVKTKLVISLKKLKRDSLLPKSVLQLVKTWKNLKIVPFGSLSLSNLLVIKKK